MDGRNELRPDVVAIREEGASRTPVLVQDVLLAVEVISPDSSIRDRRDKLKLYAQGKIPAYWVIDPLGERVTFTEFVLDGDQGYRRSLVTDGSVTVEDPWKIALDLPSWTRRRNRLRDVARPAD
jgi:Uma2 family endonuclease